MIDFLGSRTNLSKTDLNRVGEQLEGVWQQVLNRQNPTEKIITLIKETNPEELNTEKLNERIQELVAAGTSGNGKSNGIVRQAVQTGVGKAIPAVMERVNLSDVDIDKISRQLQQLKGKAQQVDVEQITHKLEELRDKAAEKVTEIAPVSSSKTIQADIEDYILNSLPWQFSRRNLLDEFKEVIYDPNANSGSVSKQLSQLNKEYFVYLSISEYLRNTNLEELNPEGIQQDLTKLLNNPKEGALAFRDRLSQVDRETLVKLLSQREDLSEEQVNQTIDQVEEAIQNIVRAPQRLAKRAGKQVLDFEANLENYLRNTDKEELNPEGIKRDLQILVQDPRAGMGTLLERVSQFDRETLVAVLSQREDISEEEANQIVDRIVSVRDSIQEQFQQIQQKMQSILDSIFGKVRDYLNSLERPELNYEGIKQDFAQVFDDPKIGFEALRDRLGEFDRDTLVAVLSSREDISEEQANQIVNRIEEARNSVLHQAERIQQETQKRLNAIKAEAKRQAKDTRKAVTDAAWWLFGASFTSLVASAIAGYVAVSY